jgi:hypothetical protein
MWRKVWNGSSADRGCACFEDRCEGVFVAHGKSKGIAIELDCPHAIPRAYHDHGWRGFENAHDSFLSTTTPEESVTVPRRVLSVEAICAAHDCATNKIHKERMTARAQWTRDWPGWNCGRINRFSHQCAEFGKSCVSLTNGARNRRGSLPLGRRLARAAHSLRARR